MKIDVTVYNDDQARSRTIEVVEMNGEREVRRTAIEPAEAGGKPCCSQLVMDPAHHLVVRFKPDEVGA